MAVATGRVLSGLEKHDQQSANSVFRGDVLLQDGSIKRAFVKDLDPRQLGNELLVGALAQSLGVAVPEIVIAFVPSSVSTDFSKIAHPLGGGYIAFCSVDAEGSTVAQIVQRDGTDQHVLKYVKRSPIMGRMYGLDTWVANVDRHRNNLIVRGDGSVTLIDHGHCFTGPTWSASSLNAGTEYRNKLRLWLTPALSAEDKDAAMADMRNLTQEMLNADVQAIVDDCLVTELYGANDCDAVVGFLEARISHVIPLGARALDTL